MLKQIAQLLFDLFVINRKAIAVQLNDGQYITQYVSITENDIYCMLKEKKSLGTYQQIYKSPYLKWICLDFDCNDKSNPDLESLYQECIKPVNDFLISKNIYYINEFSGRRGIHIWIIFDRLIEKSIAYEILTTIYEKSRVELNTEKFGLDKFPATANSKGNIIGKQVKIPLSTHKKGMQSHFFSGKYCKNNNNAAFYEEQLQLLQSIKQNKIENVLSSLNIQEKPKSFYRKLIVPGQITIDVHKVIEVLSQTLVYKQLFNRFLSGQPILKDWFVLLGTFGKINNASDFLLDILKYSPNFSENESREKIKEYGSKYFPATFDYLYKYYGLPIEDDLNPAETGLEYLFRKLNISTELKEWKYNEITNLQSSKQTIHKELKYLFTNDEVPVVTVFLDFCYYTKYDIYRIDSLVEKICHGEITDYTIIYYYPFVRIEADGRQRTMISLNAFDRVLTTQLALKLAYKFSDKIKSYSYNPNYLSQQDIFVHWFIAWGNYLDHIKRYITLGLYENISVITIDIKHFYDSIDFLGVYKLLNDTLGSEEKYIIKFLINYNEQLMRLTSDTRKGVPQGPAYARIIAEIFLSILIDIIKESFKEQNVNIDIIRYVDDIIIFNNSELSDELIFNTFKDVFMKYGLLLNTEKSKIYGKIKNLSDEDKEHIIRKNQFQYELKESPYSYLFSEEEILTSVRDLILQKADFDISDINYFFSKCMNRQAKKEFFFNCYKDVISCEYGRGSSYSLFYNFIFDNSDMIDFCIINSVFLQIPENTINFSCFLAALYYAIRNGKIVNSQKYSIIENTLNKIELKNVASLEDRSTIEAIKRLV